MILTFFIRLFAIIGKLFPAHMLVFHMSSISLLIGRVQRNQFEYLLKTAKDDIDQTARKIHKVYEDYHRENPDFEKKA